MRKLPTPIQDLWIIIPEVYGDSRGWLYESFNIKKLADLGIIFVPKQSCHSKSAAGALRGIHFQESPRPMAKLVRCTRGRLWDVAVDLRKQSPTFMQWFGIELSEENKQMLYVPAGFGHGFYAFTECELQYQISETFDPSLDNGVAWNDPEIGISWPLDGKAPILSEKDQKLPRVQDARSLF